MPPPPAALVAPIPFGTIAPVADCVLISTLDDDDADDAEDDDDQEEEECDVVVKVLEHDEEVDDEVGGVTVVGRMLVSFT